MNRAMSSLTNATRSFLATARSESPIMTLHLKLYLINNYASDIGPVVSEAIGTGTLKGLNLAILNEKEIEDCTEEQMLQQACAVDAFFSSYPSIFCCLSKLSLYNLCFAEWDIHYLLFECCKQLQHLYLSNRDMGGRSVTWKIDAPDSKLRVLQLYVCVLGKLEVLCLPKLERLEWDTWLCPFAPLSFGVVPSLKELNLTCAASNSHHGFVLSDIVSETTGIEIMKLDFQGEKLWIQPEGRQFIAAFRNLRKLPLHGILVDFHLLWTMVLLDHAPFLEMFDIEVWEHPCQINEQYDIFGERTSPSSWKVPENSTSISRKSSFLKELQIIGFKPLKQQVEFVGAVMRRSPGLDTALLKYDDPCEDCEKMGILPPRSSTECVYPKSKD